MNAIVAVDNKWGIGCNGSLLFSIPEDLRYFKELTENKIVIMGRCTLNSLPRSEVLKNRTNIILSKDENLTVNGAIVCNSIDSLMTLISDYNQDDVFVIGGQTIYEQLLSYCSRAYITKINVQSNADRFFPNIDNMRDWELVSRSADRQYKDLVYYFTEYSKVSC